MPYIKEYDRMHFEYVVQEMMAYPARTKGELNYLLTRLAQAYLDDRGMSYDTVNDILGAFEGAKLEFYRRVAAPYEDAKIKQNGDVYAG